jgi:hypothetical protein
MIVPIWDTLTTITRRYRNRISIFQADDYHLHHRLVRLGFSPSAAVLCLLLITAGTILFALSGVLQAAWLGLPAMGAWMWSAQLGALRHLENRKYGTDLFTEVRYALGLDARLEEATGLRGRHLAEIIDLQAQTPPREPVTRPAARPARVVEHPASAASQTAARSYEQSADDAVLSSSKDVS